MNKEPTGKFAFCILMLMALASTIAQAQTAVNGNLQLYINTFTENIPRIYGGNEYQTPSSSQLTRFGQALQNTAQGNLHIADSIAVTAGYRLLLFTDTTSGPGRLYYVLEKNPTSTTHWGTFILAASPQRPNLIIQCPHPLYDSQTEKQGIFIFLRTGAHGYFVAGTHRCNNLASSSCTGTSTSCTGVDDPYKISDPAHVTNSTFQRATEVLVTRNPQSVFIQLHGFGQETGDPDAIMSNGTRQTPSSDYLVAIRNALLDEDATLTFKIVHIDLSWSKLTAFDNTQGRYLNGSINPCSQTASTPSARFVHIEQAFDKLRSSQQNWMKMSNALASAFPATSDVVGENGTVPREVSLYQNYPNPFNPSTKIMYRLGKAEQVNLQVFDLLGRVIATLVNEREEAGEHSHSFTGEGLASGIYFYQIRTSTQLVMRKMVLVR